MVYPYGLQNFPAVGGGLPGLPRRSPSGVVRAPRGEIIFDTPGEHLWTVPDSVHSVCVVCVGGGAGGHVSGQILYGGGGGALAWFNDIPVMPGMLLKIVVGDGGPDTGSRDGKAGGSSYVEFPDLSGVRLVEAGGSARPGDGGGLVIRGNGGAGGAGGTFNLSTDTRGSGGGGAGGYSGDGGDGGSGGNTSYGGDGTGGAGAGGRGGAVANGGGGVGLFGEGDSGTGGAGAGGSGGRNGSGSGGGLYGGGGDAARNNQGVTSTTPGAQGAVRILWGKGRAFPSTDVGPT